MSNYFYILVFALFLASCTVNAEDEETKVCVNQKMDVCNKAVKRVFLYAANMAKDIPALRVYCRAMKELFECVKNQVRDRANPCKSRTLRKYHFIVLAYLGMDKIMGTCSQDVTEIKTKILDHLAPDKIEIAEDFIKNAFEGNPKITDCAKAAHRKCVKQFTGQETQSENLCFGVRDFIKCYQDNKCVGDKISVSFARLITRMSDELINAFEANDLCVVKKTEL